ncbi:hypothetical protein DVH24_039147 [Malus domestica]|uniref:Uncharacterized protein n=1 Tax=Malus domestica TaxID=3750 RepID=A0A498KHA6_MALDO|nr:hypothetical protein DVH24_039147 [Malus domestica]
MNSTHGLVLCMSQNPRSSSVTLSNPKIRYYTRITPMVVLSSKPLRYKIIQFSQNSDIRLQASS